MNYCMGSVIKHFTDKHRALGSKRDKRLVRHTSINQLGEWTFTAESIENTETIVSLLQVCIAVYAKAWSHE